MSDFLHATTLIRLYWDIGSSGVTHNLVSAQTSDDTFRIAGDYTRNFLQGTSISVSGTTVGGNDGTKTVLSDSTFDGTNTVIPISTNLANDGAVGLITEPHKFIEFDWARAKVIPSEPAQVDKTNKGRARRTIHPNAKRFANGLVLLPLANDILIVGNNNVTLRTTVRTEAYDDDTLFLIYHYESNYDNNGSEEITRNYYKGYLDFSDGQDLLGSLMVVNGEAISPSLNFTCTEDGTFTYLGNSSTMSART